MGIELIQIEKQWKDSQKSLTLPSKRKTSHEFSEYVYLANAGEVAHGRRTVKIGRTRRTPNQRAKEQDIGILFFVKARYSRSVEALVLGRLPHNYLLTCVLDMVTNDGAEPVGTKEEQFYSTTKCSENYFEECIKTCKVVWLSHLHIFIEVSRNRLTIFLQMTRRMVMRKK